MRHMTRNFDYIKLQINKSNIGYTIFYSKYYRFYICELRCDVKSTMTGIYALSVTEQIAEQPRNILYISQRNQNLRWNFTVCLAPIHSNFSDTNRLVEFIEMHRILGAQKIVVYNISIGPAVNRYLEMYKSSTFIDVHQFQLPSNFERYYAEMKQWYKYYSQIGAINDCLYRYMYTSKYIAFVDLDEMIIPVHNYTWNDLMSHLEQIPANQTKCGFAFQNIFYDLYFTNDEEIERNETIKQNRIFSLLKTKRSHHVFEHFIRSKLIVNPRRLNVMSVHKIIKVCGACNVYKVGIDTAILHHYRYFKKRPHWMVDRTMLRYSNDLLSRIIHVKNIMESKKEKKQTVEN